MQHNFPDEFLLEMGRKKALSEETTRVFIRRIKGKKNSEIGKELFMSEASAAKHMSKVYDAFEIEGKEKGKDHELRKELDRRFDIYTREYKTTIESHRYIGSELFLLEKIESLSKKIKSIESRISGEGNSFINDFSSQSPIEFINDLISDVKTGQVTTQESIHRLSSNYRYIVENIASNSESLTEKEIILMILVCFKKRLQKISKVEFKEENIIASNKADR